MGEDLADLPASEQELILSQQRPNRALPPDEGARESVVKERFVKKRELRTVAREYVRRNHGVGVRFPRIDDRGRCTEDLVTAHVVHELFDDLNPR